MAYDEILADRIRDLLGPAVTETVEKRMFGGLGFLVGGNMALAASGQGGLLVRVDPAEAADLINGVGVTPMVMGGREMRNWLHVLPDRLSADEVLGSWIERGMDYARSLPPK